MAFFNNPVSPVIISMDKRVPSSGGRPCIMDLRDDTDCPFNLVCSLLWPAPVFGLLPMVLAFICTVVFHKTVITGISLLNGDITCSFYLYFSLCSS